MTKISNLWEKCGRLFPIIGTFHRIAAFRGAVVGAALFATRAAFALGPDEQLQFANGLYGRGMYELAVREYSALITNPAAQHVDTALFRLGECQRLLGKKAEADAAYGQLVQKFPASEFRFRGEYRRAEMHVSGGEFLEAVSYFRALLAANPPDDIRAPALYYHGFAQDRLLLTNEAEVAYAELVGKFSASPFYSLGCVSLGELKEKRGAPVDEARELYTKAADKPASPRVGAESLFKLADLEFRNRNFSASADAYTKLLATYPKDDRAVSNQLAAAWAFHNAARYPIALTLATSQVSVAPEAQRAEWLYLKANSERQLKQEEAAITDYSEMIQKFPSSPLTASAAFENATLLFQKNRHADVLALASMIDQTNKVGIDVYWMLAESHSAMKQPDAAIANYRKLIEQYATSDRAPLSLFRIAKLQQELGKLEESSASYRQFAKNYPQHSLAPDALAASAACQLQRGKKDESVADWAALAAAFPAYPVMDEVLYAKAQAEVDLGKTEDAKATLEQFIKSCPKSALLSKAHYLLGVLQEKTNQFDTSAYHYAAALALKPDAATTETLNFRRIAVLQRQGKNDEAAAALQPILQTAAVEKVPHALLDWLARWQLAKQNFVASEEAATNLIARATDPVLKNSGWYIAGQARQGLKNFTGAREAFAVVAATTNTSNREVVEASLHLGESLLALNDFAAASASFARAAELANTDALLSIRAHSYHGLGLAAAAQQKWEDASRYFMSVAVLFDDTTLTPECLYRAADAFGQQKKPEDRQKTLDELKKRYPESEWAKK